MILEEFDETINSIFEPYEVQNINGKVMDLN